MANLKVCKVCGKEYEPCRSLRQAGSVFNWRAVACSPQCGQEYFRQVEEARGHKSDPEVSTQSFQPIETTVVDCAFDEEAEIETFFD